MLTTFKDVLGALLLAFLLPVWMALGLGVVAVVVARQLYWWIRGNTSVVSRSATGVRSSGDEMSTRRAPDPLAAVIVARRADASAAGGLQPAVPGASGR